MATRPKVKAGLDRWLRSLRESGDIVLIDDALVSTARALAMAVDDQPSNGALWREYRQLLDTMRQEARGGVSDDTAAFLASIQTPRGKPAVGNSEDA